MHNDQQPSLKTQLIGCLVGCFVIVVAGFGLSAYMGMQDKNNRQADLTAPTAKNTPPAVTTLQVITKKDKANALAKRIAGTQSSVTDFKVSQYTSDLASVDTALDQFDSWAAFIGKGIDFPLTEAASNELKMLYNKVERLQKKSLPVLRDRYGPALRADFAQQQQNISAMTIGRGFKTLVFTSVEFKDEQIVSDLHLAKQSTLLKMRFNKVIYRAKKGDRNQTVKELGNHADNTIIQWASNTAMGATANEIIFSAENHLPAEVTTADADDI